MSLMPKIDSLPKTWTRIGPKVKLVGKEAQCPICGRVFSTDSAAELHKPYTSPKTQICKDPGSVGLQYRTRRETVGVWVHPAPEFALNRSAWRNGGNV